MRDNEIIFANTPTAMNFSSRAVKKARIAQQEMSTAEAMDLLAMRERFIIEHVPTLHALIMLIFPSTIPHFHYMIADNEEDPRKLTLLRGKKVIARNFTPVT